LLFGAEIGYEGPESALSEMLSKSACTFPTISNAASVRASLSASRAFSRSNFAARAATAF
jgi:hypothetical protein